MSVLVLLLALLLGAPQRGPELPLNLAAAPPPPERADTKGIGPDCAAVTSSDPPATFKVKLAETDRLAYRVGEAMSYTVIIENTSGAPLALGISRDPDVAPKTISPCRVVPHGVQFRVSLVAMTRSGHVPILTASGFYGSLDVPGTTLVLQPGERARVQLPGTIWPGPGMDTALTTDPQHVRIKAFVTIYRESMMADYSENTLQIELSLPFQGRW